MTVRDRDQIRVRLEEVFADVEPIDRCLHGLLPSEPAITTLEMYDSLETDSGDLLVED